MADLWVNGASSPWRTSGYTDKNLRSTGDMPTGRLSYTGKRPIRFIRARQWLAGYGSTRSVKLYCYGQYSSAFNVAADSGANLTPWQTLNAGVADTGDTPNFGFGYDTNGMTYFGRSQQSGRNITGDSYSGEYINGQVTWIQVPTATSGPAYSNVGTDSMRVTWNAPSDDGDSAITSYVLYRSTNSNMSGAVSATISSGRTYDASNLKPGTTYYYRTLAVNKAGASVFSSITSAKTLSGGKRMTGASSSVDVTIAKRLTSAGWVDLTIRKRFNGTSWVDLS